MRQLRQGPIVPVVLISLCLSQAGAGGDPFSAPPERRRDPRMVLVSDQATRPLMNSIVNVWTIILANPNEF